jgi:lipoprotein-anchoring transpeptidase ErfK/SrfK
MIDFTGVFMKPKLLFIPVILVTALLLMTTSPAYAQSGGDGTLDTICVYGETLPGSDCLNLGPAGTLTDLAKIGMTFPLRPLPAVKPDASLTNVDVALAKVNIDKTEPLQLYASLEDAVSGNNPVGTVAPGVTRYLSFADVAYVNDNAYVYLRSGVWARATPAAYSHFQGLKFNATPRNSFGWIIDQAQARTAPSFSAPVVGEVLNRETVVQIYRVVQAEGIEWYEISPSHWIERADIRQVRINTTPPKGVTGDRWIEVNLYDQTLSVYDNRQLVFAGLISSGGEPFYTRPGLFQIYQKKPLETMSGAFEADRSDFYYLEDVPWTMYFDQARALHGAYWRQWFGWPGTHGCVNLTIGDARWLYDWAVEGDWVYVWDPSGETPTDPSLYGPGGA